MLKGVGIGLGFKIEVKKPFDNLLILDDIQREAVGPRTHQPFGGFLV